MNGCVKEAYVPVNLRKNVFIYLINVLRRTRKYLTYTIAADIFVWGDRSMSGDKPRLPRCVGLL